ncbi:MAG: hypothetical protein HY360_23640 [Verrucomicrobia bacterium]|nr:hypothetical protein [Verrucomicrobiota bacterium]
MRSTVLNRLSHAGASGLVPSEVAAAISTVEGVFAHEFPNELSTSDRQINRKA